jgi:hypothetical protein
MRCLGKVTGSNFRVNVQKQKQNYGTCVLHTQISQFYFQCKFPKYELQSSDGECLLVHLKHMLCVLAVGNLPEY